MVASRTKRKPLAAREFASDAERLRAEILDLVEVYAKSAHGEQPFIAGQSPIHVSGKVYGAS